MVKVPEFSNFSQLASHLMTTRGVQRILNEPQIKLALESEAQRLQTYLIEEIDKHLTSFYPDIYHRTGAWLESIRVNPIKQVGKYFSISITFDDNFAYHPSVVPNGEPGYVPWLMELGWKDRSFETPHFQGFQGTHYIANAVKRWNEDNRFGFVITVYHGSERYI